MSQQLAVAEPIVDDEATTEVAAIELRTDPDGLAYDPRTRALYVADSYTGAILRIEGTQQQRIATIASGNIVATRRIGGIAVSPHGTLYVSRLGYGHAGAIFRVDPSGAIDALDLPARIWRLGLVYAPREHVLYATEFEKSRTGPRDGVISRIDLATGETSVVIDGFTKPSGIAKLGPTLVVSDAKQRTIHRIELVAGRAFLAMELATEIDRPEAVVACGRDSVLFTTYDEVCRIGSVCQLWLDGRMRTVSRGPWEPRGLATTGELVLVAARHRARVLVFRL